MDGWVEEESESVLLSLVWFLYRLFRLMNFLDTHLYGAASQDDGVWRDENGNEAEGAMGKDPGRFSWAKGVVGAVQRVRGLGGF